MLELGLPLMLLALLLALGVHIGPSLALAGFVGLTVIASPEIAYRALGRSAFFGSSDYVLSTVPMFVLMAEFLVGGRMSERLFRSANVWTARLPGGLALATIGASAGMGAISGVSAASSATMSAVAVPEMRKHGYDDRLSLGAVAAGGTLSVLIPPSVTLIVFGVLTESSITGLFLAGLVPGLLTAVAYGAVVLIWVAARPQLAPRSPRFTPKEMLTGLIGVWPVLVLFFGILGGLYAGVMTATEAGALGAAGALVISALFGSLNLREFANAVQRAIRTTCMIFLILVGANLFADYLSLTRVAQDLVGLVTTHDLAKALVLLALIALLFLLGMFLDTLSVLVLTVPMVYPLLTALEYDALWIGIFMVKLIEIGLITPPIGMNVFTAVGALKSASIEKAFAGSSRFVLAELVIVAALIMAPALALWLPGTMN